ncbi:hypothetical protein SAMN05216191_101442 [Paenibacillus jilunlii]|uniref:Uncharacterized protein n=1 Tax=Paenibacillus jilunlii TaxID=682956 RepID=A0A1G9GJJ5_9BACL|nr:hypothetical protein SAMN05216191_101442 [Paenibacillus jilunlii]
MIQSVTDADKSIADQTGVYTTALFSVMAVIVAITVLIVALVLYLVMQNINCPKKQPPAGCSRRVASLFKTSGLIRGPVYSI